MAKSRYFWIKINETFFNDNPIYDYIMTLENGSAFMMIYINLCMLSKNTNGFLCTKVANFCTPWDASKIQSKLQYFSLDTVRVALDLFNRVGLTKISPEGIIELVYFDDFVGSDTKDAERMRQKRTAEREARTDEATSSEAQDTKKADEVLAKDSEAIAKAKAADSNPEVNTTQITTSKYFSEENEVLFGKIRNQYNHLAKCSFAGTSKTSCDWFIHLSDKVATTPYILVDNRQIKSSDILRSFDKMITSSAKSIDFIYKTCSTLISLGQQGRPGGLDNNFESIIRLAYICALKVLQNPSLNRRI